MKEEVLEIFQAIEGEIINSFSRMSVPDEPVYACSFFGFYWDCVDISEPYFTYNIEASESSLDPKLRWNPGDWIYDEHDTLGQSIRPLYLTLTQALKNEPHDVWEKVAEYQDALYCKMCMNLNNTVTEDNSPFRDWNLTKDFVIGVFEWRRGDIMNELAIACVGDERFDRLRIFKDHPAWQL